MGGAGHRARAAAVTDAILLEDVSFAWPSPGGAARPVLDLPRFSVAPGERVFLRGPSGSGKSTLLGLIGGVLVPDRGTVTLFGQRLDSLSSAARDHFRADTLGFIFQMFNLVPYLPVVDNVLLPTHFSRARRERAGADPRAEAKRLLAALGLTDPALLARPVTALSIGQQQRVAAARALLGRPRLIIADEPTSALDHDAREAFLGLLMREAKAAETTLLFVSHDTTLGAMFDRSVSLSEVNRASQAAANAA